VGIKSESNTGHLKKKKRGKKEEKRRNKSKCLVGVERGYEAWHARTPENLNPVVGFKKKKEEP